jgi:hypothetical protein
MQFRFKSGQREIARIAMALLSKQAEKAVKINNALQLPTEHAEGLLSRCGVIVDAMNGHAEHAVTLGLAARGTLRQGLAMYLEDVEGTAEDELALGIDTDASAQKADEIKAMFAMIVEQQSFGDALTEHIAENHDEIERELNEGLPEGATATLTVHR